MSESGKISVKARILWTLFIVFVSVNLAIQITGNTYLYKALLYNFADVDDLDVFETRIINNDSVSSEWPVSKNYNKQKLPDALLRELERNKSLEFLIIKDDSILHEQYWDHYSKNSLSNSFSMAKSITSILIGIAIDEGKIKSADEPVGNYLKHFKKGNNAKLTIRNLLMISSGLNWDESYNSLFSKTTEAYYGNNLDKLVSTLNVVEEPGKKFQYMSGNTLLLGMIVEKATGMKLSDYASEKLWKPLGAALPAQWSLDHPDGREKAYCCFYSNARDFARIGKLYLDHGKWNGKQIVSAEWVNQTITPNTSLTEKDNSPCKRYGLHWWLMNRKGHAIFYMRGLYGQYVLVIPDENAIVVRLGKKQGDRINGEFHDMFDYADGVLDMLSGKK